MKPIATEPLLEASVQASVLSRPARKRARRVEYRTFLEAAPDAIVVVDHAGLVVLMNAQTEQLFGYSRKELLGQPAELLVPERFRNQQNEQGSRFLSISLEKPVVTGLELSGLRKDGTEFPIEIRLSPVETKEGTFFSSAIRDISNRRKTEEDLRRLASIVACSDDAITAKNLEGIISTWNAAAERIYGYSAQEAIGKASSIIVPADLPDETPRMLESLLRGETVDHLETVRVRKDGKQIEMEITVSPIRDALERIVGASTIARDISARKAAERHLVQMEARYRGLLEAAPDAMVVVNQDGEIVLLNVRAEKQFGYRRDELLGQQVKMIIPDGFAERLIADGLRTTAEALAQQIGTGVDLYARCKDGSEFPIEIMLSPLDGPDGILITAAIRDITERKNREYDLSRLAAVVESSHDAIISFTPDGTILTWNPAAERIYGYSPLEAMGQSILFLSPPDRSEETPTLLEKVEHSDVIEHFETIRIKKGGSQVHVALTLSPIKNLEGLVVGVSSIARDITESKKLEEMYRQAQKMEAIGQLAGGVAHDFNNILGVILGYSGLLLENLVPDDPQRKPIEQIERAADRAVLLTRQLLCFSRKQVLQPKVLDVNAIVRDAEQLLHRLIGESIQMTTVLHPKLGRVKADAAQIEQIIMNLAVNSRDAMPTGGKLTIETSNVDLDEEYAAQHDLAQPGPHVLLSVTDTGCGMDAETQAHIFEPFFTTKDFGKGTGLGLSTVYGVVKQSGGSVWVYSEPGVGTTFKIYLPCVDSRVDVAPPAEVLHTIDRGSQTILVVEDDHALLQVTQQSLERAGYAVLSTQNPGEAVRMCERYSDPIHLMVTDVVMPEMSGARLAAHLSALRPEMKVLFVSGYTDDTIVRHGVLEEGLAFLQKPFSPKALIRKVDEILAGTVLPTP